MANLTCNKKLYRYIFNSFMQRKILIMIEFKKRNQSLRTVLTEDFFYVKKYSALS